MSPEHLTSWPDVALALINNIPAILGAIGAICAAYWAYQSKKQGVVNHEAMNSRLDQVVMAKEEIAHAAGMALQKSNVADEKAAAEKRLNEIRGETA